MASQQRMTKVIFLLYLLLLISIYPAYCNASNLETERTALISIKTLLVRGDALFSWNDSIKYCQWPGITCDAHQYPTKVTSLSLESLDLGGMLSPNLGDLTFLVTLHLPRNQLKGSIPEELSQLHHLEYLNLTMNSLEGRIPKGLGGCHSLQVISLSENMMQGTIPVSLSHCFNLHFINMEKNFLIGDIPAEISLLQKLKRLILNNNYLTGSIPSSFGNLSSLIALQLSHNNLSGSLPSELGKVYSLETLDLSYNHLSGSIPSTLSNFSNLYSYSLEANHFSGDLPRDFGANLPMLSFLYMYNNKLTGDIPSSLAKASKLEMIEFGGNEFTGLVPSNLGALKNLVKLQLNGNHLTAGGARDWDFLTSLTECNSLQELDLSYNEFTGSLPNSICKLPSSLQLLRLSNNKIHGKIPNEIGNLINLEGLDMRNNMLSGSIPESIGRLRRLVSLSLHNNNLSGKIPSSLGHLSNILELSLRHNKLSGPIPKSISFLGKLQTLDISHNNLNGAIPKGLVANLLSATYINLSSNSFVGSLPDEFGGPINLNALDISGNKFVGEISLTLGRCESLQFLRLEGNLFNGNIPQFLYSLKSLQLLDLSCNRLFGTIPEFLGTLPHLQFLNLSFNDLEGKVPTTGIFSNQSGVNIMGNEKLCGGVLTLKLKSCSKKLLGFPIVTFVMMAMGSILFCSLLSGFLVYKYMVHKKAMKFQYIPLRRYPFSLISYKKLFRATNGFSPDNLIGSGGYSNVYKGTLEGNTDVAVKVLTDQQERASSKSFITEYKALKKMWHHNLLKTVGVCSSKDFKGDNFLALVYEYMSNGSLEDWLHPNYEINQEGRSLSLLQRMKIAFDVALALDYLHNQSQATIIHGDLKPGNVLLDETMTAYVGDFGLAKILSPNDESSTITITGSFGYIAPECMTGNPRTILFDVYSYGILLLEMFTGKRPTGFKDGLTLQRYVGSKFPEHMMNIIDPKLLSSDSSQNDEICGVLEPVLGIALACASMYPEKRMGMHDVVKQLDKYLEQLSNPAAPSTPSTSHDHPPNLPAGVRINDISDAYQELPEDHVIIAGKGKAPMCRHRKAMTRGEGQSSSSTVAANANDTIAEEIQEEE